MSKQDEAAVRWFNGPRDDWGRMRTTIQDWYEAARTWPGMAEKAERFLEANREYVEREQMVMRQSPYAMNRSFGRLPE